MLGPKYSAAREPCLEPSMALSLRESKTTGSNGDLWQQGRRAAGFQW